MPDFALDFDKSRFGQLGWIPVGDERPALSSELQALPLPHPAAPNFTWHRVSSLFLSGSSVAS